MFALCFLTLLVPALDIASRLRRHLAPLSGGVMLIASKRQLTDTSSAMAGLRQHSCLFFGHASPMSGFWAGCTMSRRQEAGKPSAETIVTHAGRHPEQQFGFVNTPVYRGSTVLFPDAR